MTDDMGELWQLENENSGAINTNSDAMKEKSDAIYENYVAMWGIVARGGGWGYYHKIEKCLNEKEKCRNKKVKYCNKEVLKRYKNWEGMEIEVCWTASWRAALWLQGTNAFIS